jgi:hypothetical protein
MSYISPEGLVIPASTDLWNLTPDLRTMGASIRSIVPVANRAAGDTVATAMGTDGRSVSGTNPLIVFNYGRNLIEMKTGSGWFGPEEDICKVTYGGTPQNLTSGSFTTLSWTTAPINPSALWSAGDPTKIFSQTAGYYEVGFTGGITGATTGRLALQIIQTGSLSVTDGVLVPAATTDPGTHVTSMFNMAAGDYLTFQIFQDSGSTKTTGGAAYSKPVATFRRIC